VQIVQRREDLPNGPWYTIIGEEVTQEAVHGEFVNDAEPGDLVVIHQGVVVRKITREYYKKIKQKFSP
jgi:hydrogenase maturation factor